MTFAPDSLLALAAYWGTHGGVNLGIVGDASHTAAGTSYHLGKDKLLPGAYSAVLPRDVAGLSNAASAIDLGKLDGTYEALRTFSIWFVQECRAAWGKPGPLRDVREVIYSPDGVTVWRWDGVNNQHATGPGQGDATHLFHTHISYYRDAEFREKVTPIRAYFEGEHVSFQYKAERWTLDGKGQVTTLGAPYGPDGVTPDFTQRLALVSDKGDVNPRLVLIARARLTNPSQALSAGFYTALSTYTLIPESDCTAAIAADRAKAHIVYS